MKAAAGILLLSVGLAGCGTGDEASRERPTERARVAAETSSSRLTSAVGVPDSGVPAGDGEGASVSTPSGEGAGQAGRPGPSVEGDAPVESATPTPPAATAPSGAAEGGSREASPPAATPADGTTPTQDPSTAEILRETSRAYEGLRSFRAEFEQVLRNALLGRTTRSQGTLYQRQPDRFLMQFSDPAGDLIVSDGDWFWMYFPSVDEKQVLRSPRGGQGLDLRAQFIGDPVRRFEATYHGTEEVRGRKAYVMTLEPREPLGYDRLKVWIDAADHLVRRFELAETSGNVRFFELRDLERNPSLADDLFDFEPPAGTQVVTRG